MQMVGEGGLAAHCKSTIAGWQGISRLGTFLPRRKTHDAGRCYFLVSLLPDTSM